MFLRTSVSRVIILGIGCLLVGSRVDNARADIAPPPPEIPMLGAEVPHPISLVVAGVALAGACVLLGRIVAKRAGGQTANVVAACVGVALILASLASAGWSAKVHDQHRQKVRNYTPPRPIDDRPVNDGRQQPPEDGNAEHEPEESTGSVSS